MSITNIFRIGGGGGSNNPSDFPAEKILLSGEDLTLLNDTETGLRYEKLDQDLVLSKDEAPELWEIYGNGVDEIFTIF